METAGDILTATVDDQTVDQEEEVFARTVERLVADVVERQGVECRSQRLRIRRRDDGPRREHHEMSAVDRHQRDEKQPLRVFEIFTENAGDVLGSEAHDPEYIGS